MKKCIVVHTVSVFEVHFLKIKAVLRVAKSDFLTQKSVVRSGLRSQREMSIFRVFRILKSP